MNEKSNKKEPSTWDFLALAQSKNSRDSEVLNKKRSARNYLEKTEIGESSSSHQDAIPGYN